VHEVIVWDYETIPGEGIQRPARHPWRLRLGHHWEDPVFAADDKDELDAVIRLLNNATGGTGPTQLYTGSALQEFMHEAYQDGKERAKWEIEHAAEAATKQDEGPGPEAHGPPEE